MITEKEFLEAVKVVKQYQYQIRSILNDIDDVKDLEDTIKHDNTIIMQRISLDYFSIRLYNCLRYAHLQNSGIDEIVYIKDILKYSYCDLLKFRNIGKKSLDELEDFLKAKNLSLRVE